MNNKTLTIIIPTYNRAVSLPEVVKSVFCQDYDDWRIFITDDCSVDDTKTVVNQIIANNPQYDITYHCNEKNLKEVMNDNQALVKNYQSKYVAVLQDDSRYIDMSFLSSAIKIMEEYEKVNFVAGHFKNKSGITKLWNDNLKFNGKVFWRQWPKIWTFWPACVFRYDKMAQIGFLGTGVVARADSLMLLKLALLGEVALLNRIVLEDEYNKTSGTYTEFYKNFIGVLKDEEKLYRIAADFAISQGIDESIVEPWYQERVAWQVHEQFFNCNNFKERQNLLNFMENYNPNILRVMIHHLASIISTKMQ